MKKLISLLFLLLPTLNGFAQTEEPQMADTFRTDGKIYVVVLVLSVVFACLATYLIIIDRKISKLDKKISATKLNDKISNIN